MYEQLLYMLNIYILTIILFIILYLNNESIPPKSLKINLFKLFSPEHMIIGKIPLPQM